MCKQVRNDSGVLYISEPGKSCPTEILAAIASINAEGRPIWKPMHMQPIYRMNPFITVNGDGRAKVFSGIQQKYFVLCGFLRSYVLVYAIV